MRIPGEKVSVRQVGFTLVEVMVVVVLVGIVFAIGIPGFREMSANGRITAANNQILGFLSEARSEAVKRALPARVRPIDGVDWQTGLMAWIDGNGDGVYQAGEEFRVTDDMGGGLLIGVQMIPAPALVPEFGFAPNGFERTGAAVTVTLCDDRTAETGRVITVNVGGRVNSNPFVCL